MSSVFLRKQLKKHIGNSIVGSKAFAQSVDREATTILSTGRINDRVSFSIQIKQGRMSNLDWKTFGFSDSQTETAQQIGNLHSPQEAEEFWRRLHQILSDDCPDPRSLRLAWEAVFSDWDDSVRPAPMHSPDLQEIHRSNIAKWSADAGIQDFTAFHQWSTKSPAEFWSAAVDRLEIPFRNRGQSVLSHAEDPSKSIWFEDSTLNIGESCFLAPSDSTAIVFQSPGGSLQTYTYATLRSRANQVANALVDHGFQTGDAIAVVLPMTAESVVIYLGIVLAGMSVVSIADSFAGNEIANRLKIAAAKAVFTYDLMNRGGKVIELYSRVKAASDLPIVTLTLDQASDSARSSSVSIRGTDFAYQDFLSSNESFEAIECRANDCINILFSSGTTGDPKAIPWNHLTPIKCAVDGMIHQNISEGTVAAWPTNLGWMMGPWLIFATLINRGTIALYEDIPMGEGFGKFVQDARVNMLGVVPTIVKAWRSSRCMEAFDWTAIDCFSSTGEASQDEDMFYLSALAGMRPMIEYCGGTEIGGGYISSTVVQPNVASTFSTPAMGIDFEILDAESQPADEGEIFINGPAVGLSHRLLNRDHFETYFRDTPLSSDGRPLRRHGDHMKRLAANYYIAGGRADDTMNLGGIKVSSAELERVLNQLDVVKETAAIAFSKTGPEQLVVFVVLDSSVSVGDNGEQKIDDDELRMAMNRQLKELLNPLFKVSEVRIVDSLPRTASNKVMRRRLRDELAG